MLSQGGLSAHFCPLFQLAVDSWLAEAFAASVINTSISENMEEEKKQDDVVESGSSTKRLGAASCRFENESTGQLRRILQIHATLARLDPTLGEELGRQGSHIILSRLLRSLQDFSVESEPEEDLIADLQDVAYEIAASCSSFPLKVSPYTINELQSRMPLQICLTDSSAAAASDVCVWIRQVTSRQGAQEDVGFVLWPSAIALSQWLVNNRHVLQDKTVLELGAGCGLVGLVAAKYAGVTLLTDFNPIVLHNIKLNIDLNGRSQKAVAMKLDFNQQTGDSDRGWFDGEEYQEPVDVIVAADMICQPADAISAAKTIHDALKSTTGVAYVVCANGSHRYGVDCFPEACRQAGLVMIHQQNLKETHWSNHKGLPQTSGYIPGMSLNLFVLVKP
jgi:hypothetical protein